MPTPSRASSSSEVRPSSLKVTRGGAVGAVLTWTARRVRHRVGVEELGVDRVRVDAVVEQQLAQVDDHLLGPAQEPLVDVLDGPQRLQDAGQPVTVETSGEELDVLLLA